VAYTFDAGPNACLYLLEEHVPTVISIVRHFFPPPEESEEFVKGVNVNTVELSQVLVISILSYIFMKFPLVQISGICPKFRFL